MNSILKIFDSPELQTPQVIILDTQINIQEQPSYSIIKIPAQLKNDILQQLKPIIPHNTTEIPLEINNFPKNLLKRIEKLIPFKIAHLELLNYNLNTINLYDWKTSYIKPKIGKFNFNQVNKHRDNCQNTLLIYLNKTDFIEEETIITLNKETINLSGDKYWSAGGLHFINNPEHQINMIGLGERLILGCFSNLLEESDC